MGILTVRPLPWPEFLAGFDWKLGEHVTIIGHTGSGKTHLGLELLERRGHVVTIAVKPKDELLKPLKSRGYKVARNLNEFARIRRESKILLWPEPKTLRDTGMQSETIRGVMDYIYRTGNRTIFSDELYYMEQQLGLHEEIVGFLFRGRSLGISMVCAAQRPFHVPLAAYSQASHLFFFRESDRRNLARLGEIGGVDAKEVMAIIAALPEHHFLYVSARDGRFCTSKVQRLVTRRPAQTEVPV
jgi:hypothetical protein